MRYSGIVNAVLAGTYLLLSFALYLAIQNGILEFVTVCLVGLGVMILQYRLMPLQVAE